VLLALAVLPGRAAAQGWREVQVWGVAVGSDPAVAAGGLGFALRDGGRTRIGAALAGGTSDGGRAAGRIEVAWHFLLDPSRRSGLAVYGGGGLAVSLIERDQLRPWVLMVLGVETSPASKHGFFVEAGLGGGVRAALGLRFRTTRRHR